MGYKLAVVGATGNVGREVLSILADRRFPADEVVALASGNPFLVEMIKTNARKLMAYYRARYRFPGSIAQSAKEHREIAELIFAHKREEAEAAMVRHVQFDQVTVMDLLAALG